MEKTQNVPHKDTILKILTAFHPAAKIYLFGSYARGEQKWGSDIDIAIDINRAMTINEIELLRSLLEALPTAQKIDLVDVHNIPDELRARIVKEGILWSN